MKRFWGEIKYGMIALGIFMLIVLLLVWISQSAGKFGYAAGILLSAGLAFTITMAALTVSNNAGDREGTFQDYSKKPMQLSIKKIPKERKFWKKKK